MLVPHEEEGPSAIARQRFWALFVTLHAGPHSPIAWVLAPVSLGASQAQPQRPLLSVAIAIHPLLEAGLAWPALVSIVKTTQGLQIDGNAEKDPRMQAWAETVCSFPARIRTLVPLDLFDFPPTAGTCHCVDP